MGGAISGGAGFASSFGAGGGGTGGSNAGTITTLTNRGTISGAIGGGGPIGVGGAGVSNSGTIATLSNSGAISGGAGLPGFRAGATGGAGVSNSGTITTLTNSGMISSGAASSASGTATPGDAILSAGSNASIGTIANSGSIVGNVEIDNQASVTITGGSGSTFGKLTDGAIIGAITIANGNLTFGGGNTFLGDNVTVNGGHGTVTNTGPLQIAAPLGITGSFTQNPAGALDLDFAGDLSGEYGALTISSLATLDGALGVDL